MFKARSTSYIDNTMTKRVLLGVVCLTTLIVPILLIAAGQDSHIESEQSFCPFKMITGFPCIGCGITKSLIFLFKGELVKSLAYHLFGLPLVIACVIYLLIFLLSPLNKKEFKIGFLYNKKLAAYSGISLAIYHIVRLYYFVNNNNFYSIAKESIWF